MTDRAVSTVLDVSVAVLLVGAALLTVTTAPVTPTDDVGTDRADDVADLLGGTTARVQYSLAPGLERADESVLSIPDGPHRGPAFRRRSHGTLAGLLARAATTNVTLDGAEFDHATDEFQRRVVDRTESTLFDGGDRTRVGVRWRPFVGSGLRGRIVVGESPPRGVAVHAATINVTSGFPPARNRALAVADEGYRAVADVVANATVRGLFPVDRARVGLARGYPVSYLVAYRHLHAGALVGADVEPVLAAGDVRAATRRIERALADRFERRLRARYPTPVAAARAVRVETVTITVRTWSP